MISSRYLRKFVLEVSGSNPKINLSKYSGCLFFYFYFNFVAYDSSQNNYSIQGRPTCPDFFFVFGLNHFLNLRNSQ
jgi:hypothetical protein